MSGLNVTKEDLTAHFHLPISEAARRLNICTTVMKKICRQHGISRWPQRKVAALNKRIKALEYERGVTPSMEKKASISEQLKFLNEELSSILDGTAPCLSSSSDDMDSEPTSPIQSRKRKHDGLALKLDKMEVDFDDSHDSSPYATFTPRNPFPQNSPRYRLENNRAGIPSPHSGEDSSEFVDESPRSDAGNILPSMPQDDAMTMLLDAITSVETEQSPTSKRMRTSTEVSLPSLSSLKNALYLDSPRSSFSEPSYGPYAYYDYTPRPTIAPTAGFPYSYYVPYAAQQPQQMPGMNYLYNGNVQMQMPQPQSVFRF
jgi:hypothetical protein